MADGAGVWVHWLGTGDAAPTAAAFEPLFNRGFRLGRRDQDASPGMGVLVVATASSVLRHLISDWSHGGLHRLLVVAGDRAHLGDGDAWELLHAGASDVLIWSELPDPIEVVAARLERWTAIDEELTTPLVQRELVGQSRAWIAVLRQVVEVARFTEASVLLLGETGTGKEQVARLIHGLDRRPTKGDLVVLDCTTVVPDLAGSEFFGHERGAFTGAIAARDGAFALADRGTLFLDEVGELPLGLQAQLLRAVQERTYKRVGSNTWRGTNFRLICATNRDLFREELHGQFRRDLYYRIAGWLCYLPPLRERPEDIPLLVRHFMQQACPDGEPPVLNAQVVEHLLTRPYPGNVRDLKQLASRIMYRHVGPGPITIGDIPEDERPLPGAGREQWHDTIFDSPVRHALALGAGLRDIRRIAEDTAIRVVTLDEEGNLQRAAARLGVTDRMLQLRRAARRELGEDDEVPLAG